MAENVCAWMREGVDTCRDRVPERCVCAPFNAVGGCACCVCVRIEFIELCGGEVRVRGREKRAGRSAGMPSSHCDAAWRTGWEEWCRGAQYGGEVEVLWARLLLQAEGEAASYFCMCSLSLPCSRLLRRLKSVFLPSSRVQDEVLRARLLQAEQATTNDCCLCVPCSLPSPPFPLTLATLLSPPRPSSRVQDEVLRARVLQAEGEAAAGRSAEGNEERVGAMKGQAEQMER
ncbi:unnamed protein product [Closterium sp. NIES-65]|nr:unnamed protein product [Closterium sp. NIES-65]